MKRVIILGAFDRYNYGDNLMPILFELFLKEFYPDFFDKYQIVFSAITSSDLSKYKAKKSVAISDVFEGPWNDIEAIISIGGEVLCASSSTLFLHMDHSERLISLVKFLKSNALSFLADFFCRRFYKLPWEYPYIPKRIRPGVKVGFNTVGGVVSRRRLGTYIHSVRSRLSEADYVSVRDKRTEGSLSKFCTPIVFPDSAITMAHFVGKEFLAKQSSSTVNALCQEDYICFQAAPKKVGASARECAETLKKLANRYHLSVKLCPIGYARGHDDLEFLREVHELSDRKFDLIDGLNIWEIMSVICASKIFIGTSLHGVITALSFSVPFIGVNPSVRKLDKFLGDWGIGASKKCYSMSEISDSFDAILNIDRAEFRDHSRRLIDLGLTNNHKLVQALELDKAGESTRL